MLITGPAGVGKTAAWRLVARQVLGPGWKSTAHVLQARDLVGTAGAMQTFENFLRPSGRTSKDTLAGRTSLEAFDRSMWETSETDDPPPAGVELAPPEKGVTPVSRLIVIEDADHLGPKRQPYLRRMMESESATSRFIFTARAPSRIMDALRSRSKHIRIASVESDRIESILKQISAKERVEPAPGILGDIIHVSGGNLRKALFTLELLTRTEQIQDRSSVHKLVAASTLQGGRLMVEMALRGRIIEWRWETVYGRKKKVLSGAMAELDRLMGELSLDKDDVVSQLHRVLTSGRLMLPSELQGELLNHLSECDVRLSRSSYPRIQFERFLHQVSEAGLRHGMAMA
jgi:replication factor C small subunit